MDASLIRGSVVMVAAPGDYGKPRPALVVQSNFFGAHPSVTVCLMSSELRDAPLFRLTVHPTSASGLHKTSQIMVDKLLSVPRARVGATVGHLDVHELMAVNRALALWVGLG